MRLVGEAITKTLQGDTIHYAAPGMTEWIDPQSGDKVLFDHNNRGGKVSVANPSRAALIKMFKVAQALRGVVHGDEGERYDASGNPTCLVDEFYKKGSQEKSSASTGRDSFSRSSPLCFVIPEEV